ncbi:hypothetical protein [Arthrobacter sp.]|uniref:hypothetical protein n=1 Tax=Arthrobacter sp. TaxID=1667 RepID=UPI003398BDFB
MAVATAVVAVAALTQFMALCSRQRGLFQSGSSVTCSELTSRSDQSPRDWFVAGLKFGLSIMSNDFHGGGFLFVDGDGFPRHGKSRSQLCCEMCPL